MLYFILGYMLFSSLVVNVILLAILKKSIYDIVKLKRKLKRKDTERVEFDQNAACDFARMKCITRLLKITVNENLKDEEIRRALAHELNEHFEEVKSLREGRGDTFVSYLDAKAECMLPDKKGE